MTITQIGDAPNLQQARERAINAVEKLYIDCSLPIYTGNKGRPDQIGTGFILQHGSHCFFVTAAHVVDGCKDNGIYIGLTPGFVQFSGSATITASSGHQRGDDRVDFAVFRLTSDMLSKLDHAKVIPEWAVQWRPLPVEGRLFSAIGYPNSRNKKPYAQQPRVRASRLIYTNVATKGRAPATVDGLPHDGIHHLMLPYEDHALDSGGRKVNAIGSKGLSGGPVWDLGRISSDTLQIETAPEIRLAGWVIERTDGTLICTRIGVLKDVLENLLAEEDTYSVLSI